MSGSSIFAIEDKKFYLIINSVFRTGFDNIEEEYEYHALREGKYAHVAAELIPLINSAIAQAVSLEPHFYSIMDYRADAPMRQLSPPNKGEPFPPKISLPPSVPARDLAKTKEQDSQEDNDDQQYANGAKNYLFTLSHPALNQEDIRLYVTFATALSAETYHAFHLRLVEAIHGYTYVSPEFSHPIVTQNYPFFSFALRDCTGSEFPLPASESLKKKAVKLFEQLAPKMAAIIQEVQKQRPQSFVVCDYQDSGPALVPTWVDPPPPPPLRQDSPVGKKTPKCFDVGQVPPSERGFVPSNATQDRAAGEGDHLHRYEFSTNKLGNYHFFLYITFAKALTLEEYKYLKAAFFL